MRFKKKVAAIILTLAMVLTFIPATVLANDTITVTIDGQHVTFADQQPIIINNRTLVPVGGVFEALGFTPSWSGRAQTATLTRDDFTIVITIGESVFTTNGTEHTLDVPAQIINNRTMLPLRAVLESIGIAPDNIGWDGNARAITIITSAEVTPPVNPAEAEAQLATFLSGMDMNAIRDALGVDFTVGMTEHDMNMPGTTASYRFLNLNGTLDITIPSGTQYISRLYSTQTGDVIMRRIVIEIDGEVVRADYAVGIDLGSAIDVWTAYPDFIPSWMVEEWGGVPYWLTTERAIVWIFDGILYQ